MVIKVYISGISGNKEVKKRQQRVLLILDSKNVKYEVIDMAEPGAEEAKDFMQNKSTSFGGTIGDPTPRHPLPPQIFNEEEYCGDYDSFDMANELDEMEKFLKLEPNSLNEQTSIAEIKLKNGDVSIDEKIENVLGKTDEESSEQKAKEDESEDKKDVVELEGSEESENKDKTIESEEQKEIEGSVESKHKEKSITKEEPVDQEDADSGAGDEDYAEKEEEEEEASAEKSDE